MRRRRNKRPMVLTVMGIVNIVVGCLAIGCGLIGVGGNLVARSAVKAAAGGANNPMNSQIAFMDRAAPGWQSLEITHDVIVIVIAPLLILAGVGLMMRKDWGRWLSILGAVACVIVRLAYAVYKATVIIPAMGRWYQTQTQPPGFAAGFRIGGYTSIVVVFLVWLAYAVAVCITMFTPSARSGCASPSSYRDKDLDEDFDDDREYRRRYDDDDDDDPLPRRRRRRDRDDDLP